MLIATNVLERRYSLAVMERAVTKLQRYPGEVQSIPGLKMLRLCIKNEHCRFRDSDIRPLFQAAADSGSVWLLNEAGIWHLEHTGEVDIGIELLRRARARGPGRPQIHMNLADALSQVGRAAEAAAVLDEMRRAGLRDVRLYQERLDQVEARIQAAGG